MLHDRDIASGLGSVISSHLRALKSCFSDSLKEAVSDKGLDLLADAKRMHADAGKEAGGAFDAPHYYYSWGSEGARA